MLAWARGALSLVAVLAVGACSMKYVPAESPISAAVPPIDLVGTVTFVNAQPSTATRTVAENWSAGAMESDLHTITEAMVRQATNELAKRAQPKSATPAKRIELSVNQFISRYVTFFFKSTIVYSAKLGDGKTIVKDVGHGHAVQIADLNGCIAEGVLELLRDADVRAYLAAP